MNAQLLEVAASASGAVQRLARSLDQLGMGNGDDLPEWLDENGRISVGAQAVEEVPRLLVRIAEYLQQLRAAGVAVKPEVVRGAAGDMADVFIRHVLDGEDFAGARFADAAVRQVDASIKDLRNVIEHHADYLVGAGHRPQLVQDRERITITYTLDPFQLRGVVLFGVEYDVGGAVEMAMSFHESLKRLLEEA